MADASHADILHMAEYSAGDCDRRPWGSWLVTNFCRGDGKMGDICEKVIVVDPGKILSLQSHKMRHETWTVLEGNLTVIVNGECLELSAGKEISVPAGAPHCMANMGTMPCIVKERQTGVCRENDIVRYFDAYGRETAVANEQVRHSLNHYQSLLEKIEGRSRSHAA